MKNSLIHNSKFIIPTLLIALIFSGCADVTHVEKCTAGEPYGFWYGVWHGIISPVSLVISLFKDDVAMYAINNNGGWYNFGFLLGACVTLGGSGSAGYRRRRCD